MKIFSAEMYEKMFSRSHRGMFLIFLALLPLCIVAGWPVNTLNVRLVEQNVNSDGFFLRVPILLGRTMTTTIVHSVELTPVIDEYHILEGRIWAWREKIKSHNAGLPSLRPERGRFLHEPPWMIVEGTGQSWDSIHYRVGSETLGKNELCLPPAPCRELWREIPGAKLIFSVEKGILYSL